MLQAALSSKANNNGAPARQGEEIVKDKDTVVASMSRILAAKEAEVC